MREDEGLMREEYDYVILVSQILVLSVIIFIQFDDMRQCLIYEANVFSSKTSSHEVVSRIIVFIFGGKQEVFITSKVSIMK